MRHIDELLDSITMYRLLLWGLGLLAVVTLLLSWNGVIATHPSAFIVSLAVVVIGAYVVNAILARIWRITTNTDSWLITALIVFFIMPPATTFSRAVLLAAAAILATSSKFLITRKQAQIFNPAAFAAGVLGIINVMPASWWIGSGALWPFVLLVGFLVARKIRQLTLVGIFIGIAAFVTLAVALKQGQPAADSLTSLVTASPLLFLSTIMLTEPATMPANKWQQYTFAGLVAVLYAWQLDIGPLSIYPETALLIGNLFTVAISPRQVVRLTLRSAESYGDQVVNYRFSADRPLRFRPGQYMEWTLPLEKSDSRGNRRTFTIASSPTENDLQVGVKFFAPPSRYKARMAAMRPGEQLFAGHVSGNFTLPRDLSKKLVFVAGGIGITPFRSMLKFMLDTDQKRDVVMIYALPTASELAYADVLVEAAARGIKVVTVAASGDVTQPAFIHYAGQLSAAILREQIPDAAERQWFVSGSHGMVEAADDMILRLGVPAAHINKDHFSGY